MHFIIKLALFLLFILLCILFLTFGTSVYYRFTRFFDKIFGINDKNWEQFAESKNLNFNNGDFFSQPNVSGDFLGHFLSIRLANLASSDAAEEYTIFELRINHESDSFEKKQCEKDILNHFCSIYNVIQSGTRLEISSENISFKKMGYIKSLTELESICQQLVNLHEIFPDVCRIGGVAIDHLLQVEHFKPITLQIIEAIASETELRIKPKASSLFCQQCMHYCSSHKADNPFLKLSPDNSLFSSPITNIPKLVIPKYYGCRQCRQSINLIEGRSLAILDNLMTEKIIVKESEIWVNWLIHRQPFDFYEVRIRQASDRKVEEFVMQVGNDSDEFRRPR